MLLDDQTLIFSATDISNHLGCAHLTTLSSKVARGELKVPRGTDPFLDMLRERGLAHEKRYLEELGAEGLVDLAEDREHVAAERKTLAAMEAGAPVIAQGALSLGRFRGRPDVLVRVGRKSDKWSWSYEVHDTKLTESTRAGAVLQLCLYWKALAAIQGPGAVSHFFIKTPLAKHAYRAADYIAYFDMVCGRLVAAAAEEPDTYPEPVDQCDVCSWAASCRAQRRHDDHLSLVARSTTLQRKELAANGLATLTALGSAKKLSFKPKRGQPESYEKTRAQADIQLRSRAHDSPLHELLDTAERGFSLLPEPTEHDLYIDFEGDQFALPYHRDYMLGIVDKKGAYRRYWALTAAEERPMFESVMRELTERIAAHPGMHIYHYAHYEETAFKRLAHRYGVYLDELDRLLRGERFVDLYKVVSQTLRAGVESYSIKQIEKLARFERAVPLEDAGASRRRIEYALETGREEAVSDGDREAVEGYNADDCEATRRVHLWLLEQRPKALPWTPPKALDLDLKDDKRAELDARERLRVRLLEGVPDVDRDDEQQARWVLAHLMGFHRREANVEAWERFDRADSFNDGDLDALLEDKETLARLTYVEQVGQSPRGLPIHRYAFPRQECVLKPKDDVATPDKKIGHVVAIDRANLTVDIQKTKASAAEHPYAFFKNERFNDGALREALAILAQNYLDGAQNAATRLLLRRPPKVPLVRAPNETPTELAVRVSTTLRGDVLPIQGPPGAGKTYTAARMIIALVRAKKRVGVTSNSHKAIRNLLRAVHAEDPSVRLAHRCHDDASEDGIQVVGDTKAAQEGIRAGEYDVLGGTCWVWGGKTDLVDVLFVDEAGQMALANVLASASACDALVLLGDPQQLEQPTRARHPEGTAVSALEHLFGEERVVPAGRGIFLDKTYRLAPELCAFTSEMFYASALDTGAGEQVLRDCGPFDGSGLWWVPCVHDGNKNASDEEVDVVEKVVERLRRGAWTRGPLAKTDIMIIAPYNLQVNRLKERLPGYEVGTVDLFQGREAAVVVFSMATSSAADAPKGMDFLFSGNRLNVATSRARAACIMVANPSLFVADCKTPEQIRLVNAFCRYRELARVVTPEQLDVAR